VLILDSLIRWTVRLAMALYVLALAVRALAHRDPSRLRLARVAWTVGCIAFLAHVACAFHFVHHWSHAAAYEDTARKTEAFVGWAWGGGLYLNYAFTILWPADVVFWWCNLDRSRVPAALDYGLQGFMAFMAFNATVVFATGPVRWLGLAACLLIPLLYGLNRSRQKINATVRG
jgi:hypothetical protein